jgi:23S rRNA (uracil1939-C5)-methyltransferase
MSSPETHDVEVRGLAAGGAGIADLPDGRVVFVPRTAPGDRARIRIVKDKRRWALGVVESLTQPSPARTQPACALYEECGGCALQHLAYEDQLRWKGRFIADALQRIGGQRVDEPTVEPSVEQIRYRNRVTFTLRRLRGGRVVAGFHALDRPAHVIEVRYECVLPEPSVSAAWTELRASWGPGARRLPAGGRLSLTLRATADGVVLVVEGGEAGWQAGPLAEATESIYSIWHRPAREAETVLVAGESAMDQWGDDRFPVEGQAFLQVNRLTGASLGEHVVTMAGEGARAIDAYCGVGLYGRALARAGWQVTGIESSAAACRAAQSDAPDGLAIREGTVEDTLADELPADLVILNPPRTGIGADVVPVLLEARPPRIIYVSCDPATLARDTAVLSAGYELENLHAFDLFPQTPHVETVAVFRAREEH